MFNIQIEIKAPELVEAIKALSASLGGIKANTSIPNTSTPTPAPTSATMPAVPTPAPAVPVQPSAPIQPVTSVVPPAHTPAPAAVPTTPQTYTMEQLAVAATQLMDAGKRQELVNLLGQFGVQALTALPKEQYGAFATALRQMGAKI